MIERAIEETSGTFTRRELWQQLPKKVMWQTYLVAINYLQSINKIALDKHEKIAYIWNPALAARFAKRKAIEL
jgi:hypothetical protein